MTSIAKLIVLLDYTSSNTAFHWLGSCRHAINVLGSFAFSCFG
jgi:hypothetical protein